MISWIATVCHLHDPYLKWSQPGVYNLYGLWAACCWWSVRRISCDKQEVRFRACTWADSVTVANAALSSGSPGLPFTYWGYLLCARGRSIFGKYLNVHLKFMVYGCKQASWHVCHKHTSAMEPRYGCHMHVILRTRTNRTLTRNHHYILTTVGFAQACPNYTKHSYHPNNYSWIWIRSVDNIVSGVSADWDVFTKATKNPGTIQDTTIYYTHQTSSG